MHLSFRSLNLRKKRGRGYFLMEERKRILSAPKRLFSIFLLFLSLSHPENNASAAEAMVS